jgi:hypothetical protein
MLLSCLHSSGSYPFRAVAFDLSLSLSGAWRAPAARSVRERGVDKGKPAGDGAVPVTVVPAGWGGHVQCGPPLVNSLTRSSFVVPPLRDLAKPCENRRKGSCGRPSAGATRRAVGRTPEWPGGSCPSRSGRPAIRSVGRRSGTIVVGRSPGTRRAPVAQRIEHLTTDQKVGGSNPSGRALCLYEPGSSLTEWLGLLLYVAPVVA